MAATRSTRRARKDPRWGFGLGLDKLSLPGGVSLGGANLKFGSDVRNARSVRSRSIRNMRGVDSNDGLTNMVGVAPRAFDVQVIMPRIRTEQGGKYGTMDVLAGTEYLSSISTPATGGANAGDILYSFMVNPTAMTKTRIAQFSPMYQRYRFRKLNFILSPAASALTNGQMIGYCDYDVDNPLPGDSPDNVNVAAAHMGQRVTKLWEAVVFPMGITDDFTTLFTSLGSEEARLIYQAIFNLICSSPIAADVTIGNLYVDYEIEFYIPQLTISTIDSAIQVLQIVSSGGTPTTADPMSSAVSPGVTQLPVNNLTYSFDTTGSGVAKVTVSNVPAGQYLAFFGPTPDSYPVVTPSVSGVSVNYVIDVTPAPVVASSLATGYVNKIGTDAFDSGGNQVSIFYLSNSTYEFELSILTTSGTWDGTTVMQFALISLGNLSPLLVKKKNRFLMGNVIDHGHLVKESEKFVTTNVMNKMMEAFEMRQKEMSKQFERMILRDGSYADTPEWIGHNPDPPEDTYLSDFAGSYKCAKREHGDLPTAAEADEIEERPFSAHLVPGPERVKHLLRYRYRPAQLAGANVKPSN